MKKSKGIILFLILIFLQILAILGLYVLQMTLLNTKQNQYEWNKHAVFNFAENSLRQVEKSLQSSLPQCLIKTISTAELLAYPWDWWESKATCTVHTGQFQYHYVIEHLGVNPCAYISDSHPQMLADYFRVTLVSLMGNAIVRLQSTVVVSTNQFPLPTCSTVSYQVSVGRQMWREIK